MDMEKAFVAPGLHHHFTKSHHPIWKPEDGAVPHRCCHQ